jgi:uncharacterized membrane protein YvlD (DUF360 family)
MSKIYNALALWLKALLIDMFKIYNSLALWLKALLIDMFKILLYNYTESNQSKKYADN